MITGDQLELVELVNVEDYAGHDAEDVDDVPVGFESGDWLCMLLLRKRLGYASDCACFENYVGVHVATD